MKKIIIVITLILILGSAALGYWFLSQEEDVTLDLSPIDFPIVGSGMGSSDSRGTTMTVGQEGQIEVNDFLKSPNTFEDPENPGSYYLGHQPPADGEQDTALFHIIYMKDGEYFNVVLNQEPIGESRRAAENYLMSALGISQQSMCNLMYTVSVPNHVNSQFSGTNLGFSFCPNAVPLP